MIEANSISKNFELSPRIELAYNFTSNITEQLISLSTGIIAISISFIKGISQENKFTRLTCYFSWMCFLLSICFGILFLMKLAGELVPRNGKFHELTSVDVVMRSIMTLQIVLFLLGLLGFIIFGYNRIINKHKTVA